MPIEAVCDMQLGDIFSQPWWLDAVAPSSWSEVIVSEGDKIVGRLPFVHSIRWLQTVLSMGQLTRNLGPQLADYNGHESNRLSYEHRILTEMIEKLPAHDLFYQTFSPWQQNILPFYWAGFSTSVNYTYIITPQEDESQMLSDMRKRARSSIRNAQKSLVVRDDIDFDSFLQLVIMTYARQEKQLPYKREVIERIDAACKQRGRRQMLFAQDAQGNLHGAIYLVWDDKVTYYLAGGMNPEFRNSGALNLLIWEGIKSAAGRGQIFDFEGSMVKSIESFFRSFGPTQMPYYQVKKAQSRLLRIGMDVQSWLR